MPTNASIQALEDVWIITELFWLNGTQWAAIEPLLPHLGGKPRVDDRRVISGILHGFREGLRWRALPVAYGPRTMVFDRFNRWSERRLWRDLFAALVACEDPPLTTMVYSTAIRAHRAAAGGKGGQRSQVSGRSRGGRTSKIHLLCDDLGRLYALLLTAGQVHDIRGARALLGHVDTPASLITDKAYDADDLRDFLAARGSTAVISPMQTRCRPVDFDAIADKASNIIERAFSRLKDWRDRHTIRQEGTKLPRRHLPRRSRHFLDPLTPQHN